MVAENYITKIRRLYNQYVDFYNAESSKLKAFSELSNIHYGLKETRSLKKKRIKKKADAIIEKILIVWVYETNDKDLTMPECIELADDINSDNLEANIKKLLNDVHGIISIDQTRKEIINELKMLIDYSDNGQIPDLIDSAIEQLEELQSLEMNLQAIAYLLEVIVNLDYPETVDSFSKLSEKDQNNVTRVGNQDWKDHAYSMPKGFYDKARSYTNKENWDQHSIYDQLIIDFKKDWEKTPSFSTIHRRLKENKIW